jgi:signal recognition particle GTPase
MRKPLPDSRPWKRSRHNAMSFEGQALTEKIMDHGSVKAIVSSAEYEEKKSREDKMTLSVSTQKLDANHFAANILRLRMKGKHDKADQLLVSVATSIIDVDHFPV